MKTSCILSLLFLSSNAFANPCEVTFGRTIVQYVQMDRTGTLIPSGKDSAVFLTDFKPILARGGVSVDFADQSNGKPFVKSAIVFDLSATHGFFNTYYTAAYSVGVDSEIAEAATVETNDSGKTLNAAVQKIINHVLKNAKARGCSVNAKAARI